MHLSPVLWGPHNIALEPTTYSVRSCLAPASGGGSLRALARQLHIKPASKLRAWAAGEATPA
jgi:hypothetical protein